MGQSSWNPGSAGSSLFQVLEEQKEMVSRLWCGPADSWPGPLCAFDPRDQARGSGEVEQLSAVSLAPDGTEAAPSDSDRTPGAPLHFSED